MNYYPIMNNNNDEYNNIDYYINPVGAIDSKGTWEKKLTDINENYDEYQKWAFNAVHTMDPDILPYLFSKVNVKFIQNSVVEYVKKAKGITIQTVQDTNNLLTIMLSVYLSYESSHGITKNSANIFDTHAKNVLAQLNKQVIEKYVKQVLSSLNMTEYYFKDISKLPMPLNRPTDANIKGHNSLGFVGFFEDNHEFTKSISSYNIIN